MKLLTKRAQIDNPSGFVTRAAARALQDASPQQGPRWGLQVVRKRGFAVSDSSQRVGFVRGVGIRFSNITSESKIRDSRNMLIEMRVVGIHSVVAVCWCMNFVVLSEAANSNSR